MSISASLVKELRERTGAGLMECKKALTSTKGDIELAIENMRKSGQAKAAKKSSRVAAEGTVVVKTAADDRTAVALEVNCETDFVARGDAFKAFADQVADVALSGQINELDALMKAELDGKDSVDSVRQKLISTIGENINIRRVVLVSGSDKVMTYSHGGRIGVVVAMTGGNKDVAKDVAMHIAASNPGYIKPGDVPQALIDKEKEIFFAQAKESGKPDNIIEKMVDGRIKKYLDEISLLGQPFVKDPKQTVAHILKAANAEVTNFVRFEVGEGIEKAEENFAEEVMAQIKGA